MNIKVDEFGPEYVIQAADPRIGMKGFLVVDNTWLGPGKGGIRMTPGVTAEEVFRLARAMTWKNSLAGIPFGGAKAGLVMSPEILSSPEKKKAHVQAFARALKPLLIKKYIAGPDVNSGEQEMQWFAEAAGDWRTSTGKPANYREGNKRGLPHELGSTGFGVAHSTRVALAEAGLPLKGATIMIHGFGNVATFAYEFLTEMGARVVAFANSKGAVYSSKGFPPALVKKAIAKRIPVTQVFAKQKIAPDKFWSLPADILIPASVTDVINDSNYRNIHAKVIVEGANIPMRENIEEKLCKQGILIVPDIVANAGGVISSYAEYRGMDPRRMFKLVEDKIVRSTRAVISESLRSGRNPRAVALDLARKKIEAKLMK